MITYHIGDATNPIETPEPRKLILHVCNDYGGWGRGFVLALSRRWKEPEQVYRHAKTRALGTIQFVPVNFRVAVVNMIAQHGDSTPSVPAIQYDAMEECLEKVKAGIQLTPNLKHSIHMPRIGCGLGGGKWGRVEQILNNVFEGNANINVYDLP